MTRIKRKRVPILEVRGLKVDFGIIHAVDGLSFSIEKGKILGVVGESGCGKSVTALSIMRLLSETTAKTIQGEIFFEGKNLLGLSDGEMCQVRGNQIAMIFQDPMTSLNPVYTVGFQIAEALKTHHPELSEKDVKKKVVSMLERVGLAIPEQRFSDYPHQMSGGMRQRVMIAMALICHPKLLIADEPTTALDVTIQMQILDLLCELQKEMGMAVMLITHDLALVTKIADKVIVMHAGKLAEKTKEEKFLKNVPLSPVSGEVLLQVKNLEKKFPRHINKALNGIDLEIYRGETLGLVGESGSGKSTFGRCILKLLDSSAGEVTYGGNSLQKLSYNQMIPFRRRMQMIFQDSYSSLNPRMTVASMLEEPLKIHQLERSAEQRKNRVCELLELVGLSPECANRYPHAFSGGQRQRIGIARALAVKPEFIICDEPVSSLDISIQTQILNLLLDLQARFKLTYLFISHDLRVIKYMSHRVAVIYMGKIVETADCETLYANPQHPYTRTLLTAALRLQN